MQVPLLFSAFALLGNSFSTAVDAVEHIPVAQPQDLDGWSDVPLETSEDEGFKWELAAEDSRQTGNEKDIKPVGASSAVAMYPSKNVAYSSIFDELGGDIPLEGEVPALRGKRKSSALEQTKRIAEKLVLAAPRKEKLSLLNADSQSGTGLKEFEEKEEKRKKRRGKLELERLQRHQRKKYDSKVELIEQNASRKRRRFKALRKSLRYVKKLLEGGH